MAQEEKTETLELGLDPNEAGDPQDTIDLSGIDLDAIAGLSDEDLEKAIADIDAGEDDKGGAEGAEPGGAQSGGEVAPAANPPKPDEHSEELERLRKQVSDKEQYIQGRNRTIGDLRKQLETLLAIEPGPRSAPPGDGPPDEEDPTMKEAFFRDPIGTMERLLAERGKRQQLKTAVLQTGIREAIPEIEDLKEDIAEMALEDGWDRGAVESFRVNLTGDLPLLKAYTARVKLAKELKSLQTERDALLKKVKELPKAILAKVDAAAKKRTHISGSGGGAGGEIAPLHEKQLADLTDEDLDRMLTKLERSED